MQKNRKPLYRILITGDWHCGDKAGLTPPSQWKSVGKVSKVSGRVWDWFAQVVKENGPFDATFFTGDMVEGQNSKNTIELFKTDTEEQAEIAAECASIIPCPKDAMLTVYGTPFHTAGTYSFENHFTDTLGIARPENTHRIVIADKVRVNLRHYVGRSSIPYGQGTPTYKEMVNELLDAIRKEDAAADVVIRGHAHYDVSMRVSGKEAIVVPCLKLPGGVFGRRVSESQYDLGIGILEVYGVKDWIYRSILLPLEIGGPRTWKKVGGKA